MIVVLGAGTALGASFSRAEGPASYEAPTFYDGCETQEVEPEYFDASNCLGDTVFHATTWQYYGLQGAEAQGPSNTTKVSGYRSRRR